MEPLRINSLFVIHPPFSICLGKNALRCLPFSFPLHDKQSSMDQAAFIECFDVCITDRRFIHRPSRFEGSFLALAPMPRKTAA